MKGLFESGDDVVNLRNFPGLTQTQLAEAIGIDLPRSAIWEQDRRNPDGPAIALLRIGARLPRIIRENLESARDQIRTDADWRGWPARRVETGDGRVGSGPLLVAR